MKSIIGLIIFIFSVFHGQTARVKLYTGEVHHGSITSNDDFYSIQTVRGTYRIPHQKIQQVKAGRGEWIGLGEYIELREDPSFSSEKILRIFQGTTLRQTGKLQNGFREVSVHDRRGWVHSQFLTKIFQKPERTNPKISLITNRGPVLLELFEDEAPNTTANFIKLVETKFYQGLSFYRVDKGFLVMAGDPEGSGQGGPGYMIKSEISANLRNQRGYLGMADSGKDTAGSQFYILLADAPHLDGRYTVFGKVLKGFEIVPKILVGDEIKDMEVVEKRDHEYSPEIIPLTR